MVCTDRFVFQNILCWSLSVSSLIMWSFLVISKHLMLKFINQWHDIVVPKTNFKTSYVEVYPICLRFSLRQYLISKHLMLKFINKQAVQEEKQHLFQNILCWSLSHIFSLLLSPFIYFPLHFSWFLSFLPSISPYSFSYPISHKFPDFTILSQHFSFFRLVNISTTHNQAWGARQMSSQLKMRDHKVGRSKTRLCMTKMGIDPIYPKIIIKHTITNLFFIFKAK